MFFFKHRLKMTLLRIGKHRIVKNIASLRKVNIAHPYTESVNNLSAHLLVLDLLGGDGLGGADFLGRGCAHLGYQDHVLGDTGGSRGSVVGDRSHRGGNSVSLRGGNVVASTAEQPSVSLSIGISSRGGASEGSHTGKGENLRCLLSPDCELDVSEAEVLTLEFILNWMTFHDGCQVPLNPFESR